MSNQFRIFEVSSDAAQAEEPMGTKQKFWFRHPEMGKCLFKLARLDTGEDWSEKIAAELAQLLRLPHAREELAVWNDRAGTISPAMLSEKSALTHGNDVLARMVSSYPRDKVYKVSEHTLDIVLRAVGNSTVNLPPDWVPPNGITTAVETFVGYLLLDAWIGNGDRHHENWGFIETIGQSTCLSPTYDHASSLGRELPDSKRQERIRLSNLSRRLPDSQRKKRIRIHSVEGYTDKAKSAFYASIGARSPLLTVEAFNQAAQRYPKAASIWLKLLSGIEAEDVQELFRRIPPARISPVAIEFAQQLLTINKGKLLGLQEELL